jgi:predicted regulator of Ras-like GTPase activity (Roadblock/LC7/MglB family)
MQFKWHEASVALPTDRLDAALKTGRVVFTWGELIQWLNVPESDPSLNKAVSLELPLKVIAPLFLAQRHTSIIHKKVSVGDSVPNLFTSTSKPSRPAAPVSAAAKPTPLPKVVPSVPAKVAPSSASAPTAAPASVLGDIFGQPFKHDWSPQEVTQGINALPGVAASLVAMSDGLLVAGDLPAPLKSETMAAFLPQMFGRMGHYSGEIQLGALSALTLLAGQTECAVFKTPALYLAVLGRSGETLPHALLKRIAGELAKRNP